MNNYFESILMNATIMCDDRYAAEYEDRLGFAKLYPFTTENIAGYIYNFNLNGKSILTLGSSGDQVINASLFNCKKQTVVDICPYTKFYFYLKKTALLTLDYHKFLSFFCYKDFCKDNKEAFDINLFLKLKPLLRILDYESYLFWDELFSSFPFIVIRQQLFSTDEDKIPILKHTNIYLRDESSYELAKCCIWDVDPLFIIDDIFKTELHSNYDGIILSNLLQYYPIEFAKVLVDKLSNNLNENGKMLICYLYKMTCNTLYKNDWAQIYDLDRTFELLKQYKPTLESFIGTHGILFDNPSYKDSILIYKK